MGKVLLSHFSSHWNDRPSKPTKLVLERQTHTVGYSFILSQLLPGLPLPWAALWFGGWDSAVHISALLAGALLVSRRDCRFGGRRRDLLLPVSFYVHQHFTAVAVPSRDSSSMQPADFSILYNPFITLPSETLEPGILIDLCLTPGTPSSEVLSFRNSNLFFFFPWPQRWMLFPVVSTSLIDQCFRFHCLVS